MSEPYDLAPEFVGQPSITLPSNRLLLRLIGFALKFQRRGFAWSDRVTVRSHEVPGVDGNIGPGR